MANLPTLPDSLHRLLESRATESPLRPFVRVGDRWWTYGDIERHASALAASLRQLGVQRGEHVVVMMPSSPLYLALWFALSKLGAVEVPVNAAYRGEVLTHILRTAQPSLALVHAEHRMVFDQACTGLLAPDRVLDPLDAQLATPPVDEGGKDTIVSPGVDVDSALPACIIFTSGTTGLSKGVMVSHRHLLSFGYFFSDIVHFTSEDTAYNFLPFFHVAAKFQTIGAILHGGRMMLRPTFSLSGFWPDVRASGATLCMAVGGLCHLLNSAPPRSDDADNSLRLIYAVPLPWEFKEAFEQRFDLQLVEAYGSTEANLPVYIRLGEATPRGSCGRASPYFEVSLQDEQGNVLPSGEAGEICIRARHVNTMMSGYLGMPDKTAEAMRGGWFHSGDRATMDDQGYFYFLDRTKDAIRRRGENVSSFEVERSLAAHPDVAEVAVIPVKADVGEDEIKAVVVRKPGATLSHEALLRFAVEALPYFMVPRYIEFRDELPRTETMKVRKVALREQGITSETWDAENAGLRVTRRGIEHL